MRKVNQVGAGGRMNVFALDLQPVAPFGVDPIAATRQIVNDVHPVELVDRKTFIAARAVSWHAIGRQNFDIELLEAPAVAMEDALRRRFHDRHRGNLGMGTL
jgi:hypothetical protein